MLFGELQRPADSIPKRMARTMISRYSERLAGLIEAGKACGELDAQLNVGAAATLFVGTIQGLVMQSLLAGDTGRVLVDAPNVFAIYRRGIEEVK
jgi:hypothetical protein